ncbi:MAG: alpha/beta hydrolase [Saprospiraceae bacterium]|nr:alpha/beta hydrolase [Saprospiraceae bacterium]
MYWKTLAILLLIASFSTIYAQTLRFEGHEFEISNVKAAVVDFAGEQVLKVERDLDKLPYENKDGKVVVDEPTFVKLKNLDFTNGVIEVKVLSRLLKTAPSFARGFIGVAFRIGGENDRFESVYLRPTNGRADDQFRRNHSIQYFSYPDYKFDRLRKEEFKGQYETYSDMGLDEWITMRIEINGKQTKLFLNNGKYPVFIVNDLKHGDNASGNIGLWVEIGTEGYFKDLEIIPEENNPTTPTLQLIRAFQPPHIINKTPYGANEKAGHYVQAKDAKIYYEVYGQGQPIVLLHGGLFGSLVEMSDFIDHLKADYQVIAINTRGHGKSSLGTEPLTLQQRANDAMAVINAVTKDSVTVIGFSDGGYTAYQLAAMYPSRVKKMVVMGAGALSPGDREFNFTAAQAEQMDSAFIAQHLRLNPEPDRLEEMFAGVCACYNKVTVGKEMLSSIKCPVLVMAGDRDGGNPVERVVSAARHIPRHQISIISNTGHGCFLENWQAVWASVMPFLRD